MPWSSSHLKDITNDHPVGDDVHSGSLYEHRQLFGVKLNSCQQCSMMRVLNSRHFFFHTVKTGMMKTMLSVFIFAGIIMGIKKVEGTSEVTRSNSQPPGTSL